MSPNGHRGAAPPVVQIGFLPLLPGTGFRRHTHARHQIAWASEGVAVVVTDAGTWVLPPTRALFVPAGVHHEITASVRTVFRPVYLDPAHCPVAWAGPVPLAASRLLGALVDHLAEPGLAADARARAEAVLYDLLEADLPERVDLPWPTDPRVRAVAEALLADPTDQRDLAAWGRRVGASARTLSRAFLADTGIGFQRWRTLLRLRAALPYLAAGDTIARAANRAGYEGPSAFVAAFRRETGRTPAAYFAHRPPHA